MLIFVYGMTQRVKNLCKMQEMQETRVQSLGQEDSPGERFQYSRQENLMDRRALRATVHGVAESEMTEHSTFINWP